MALYKFDFMLCYVIECEYEVISDLSNSVISSDLE